MRPWPRYRRYRPALLSLTAALALAASALAASVQSAPAQPTLVKLPSFDVVSIKLNKSGADSMGISTHAASFTATNVNLKMLLLNAYNLKEAQLVGLPSWGQSTHFDIQAKVLDPDLNVFNNLTQEQRGAMLQAMLAERFQLKLHPATAILPVYELTLAKGGPKFKPSASSDNQFSVRNNDLTATAALMSSLAFTLSSELQRIVIDKTGLPGKYDIALKWSPDDAPADPSGNAPPPLFTAIQEQLGLKLVPAKAPIQTFVVDHLEMPSEN